VNTEKYSIQDIRSFIVSKTGCKMEEVYPDCDIKNDLGCWGDDFHELIEEFAKKYNVKMEGYSWYFHSEEEGHIHSFGRFFFKAPYERVKQIPVTPNVLLDSANAGRWLITYPEDKLPRRRYDVLINQIVLVLFVAFVIYKCAS